MIIFLIIYFSGYIASYFWFKYIRSLELDEPLTNKERWKDIVFGFKFSFLSWIAVILTSVFFVKQYFEDNDVKPPKWL